MAYSLKEKNTLEEKAGNGDTKNQACFWFSCLIIKSERKSEMLD